MGKVRTIFEDKLVRIEKAIIDYNNNPYDPDRAHQIRVPVRELRALINFFKKNIDDNDYDLLNDNLKEIAYLYGPMRELDVLIDYISQIALAQPNLSDAYYEIFRILENDRRKEMRKTITESKKTKIQNNIREIKAKIEILDLEIEGKLDKWVNKRIKKRRKKLSKAYETIQVDDYEASHQTRILAKKVRYAANDLQELTDKDLSKTSHQAKEIQNELGAIVDHHVNLQLLENYHDKLEDEEVIKLITDIMKVNL